MKKDVAFESLNRFMPGIKNLDPLKEERKRLFLSNPNKSKDKEKLQIQLEAFSSLLDLALNNSADIESLINLCIEKSKKIEDILQKNFYSVVKAFSPLERSYNEVNLFFENCGKAKNENISFINVLYNDLPDKNKSEIFSFVREELNSNYDRLDLRNNYSLLLISGYLGDNVNLTRWMKMAYENKVMLCTDFADLTNCSDVAEVFESQYHTGGEMYKSNTLMCCNWIKEQKYIPLLGDYIISISPALALGGKLYSQIISQPSAGKKYGQICGASNVAFPLKKSEISYLESIGLIPLVKEFENVMAFSAKTLFNGTHDGLKVYSVVRVFDYITKVLVDFLNRRAFENWTSQNELELRSQIVKFLDSIEGAGKLIEKFKISRFERDYANKDKIYLDINILPFFPAKSFLIKMDGTKTEDETKWNTQYNA